ncbi:MAG: ATP-binding protein [Bacteroidetes bacterium]|nr:ATP-binding protein [Bacteroidota bacterium]
MIFKKQELSIESGLQNLYKIEKFVEEISDFFNVNNTYFGNILIALTEAVKNAIVHGNKEDIDKKVLVIFESKPSGLTFIVKDEGGGFDSDSIPNPTDLEVVEGRKIKTGLYLIRSLADEVNFKDNGRQIEIQFYISSINYQLAVDRSKALKEYFHTVEIKQKKEE